MMNRNDLLLLAEAGSTNDAVTSMLIEMIVGTCIMRAGERKKVDPTTYNLDFAPADMNRMWQEFEVIRTDLDTGRTSFSLRRREQAAPKLGVDNEEDTRGAVGQAQPQVHDRPWWCVRSGGILGACFTGWGAHISALEAARDLAEADEHSINSIENRFCTHHDCPTNRCNHAAAS